MYNSSLFSQGGSTLPKTTNRDAANYNMSESVKTSKTEALQQKFTARKTKPGLARDVRQCVKFD